MNAPKKSPYKGSKEDWEYRQRLEAAEKFFSGEGEFSSPHLYPRGEPKVLAQATAAAVDKVWKEPVNIEPDWDYD